MSRHEDNILKITEIIHNDRCNLRNGRGRPNIIEKFLVTKFLVKRETNPVKISNHIKKIFELNGNQSQKRAEKIVNQMEDPIEKLIQIIKN